MAEEHINHETKAEPMKIGRGIAAEAIHGPSPPSPTSPTLPT
jgi:hypothetical protein